ncbi:hypothetical protein CRG98_040703 [Punica granatum]|uniref:Uncharacterized protein n=1 Tax=Punica granatum TaxID=22663 RepID=A0A2I0I4P0_PUNGR|nr:hypothetical protein CRG98_040703 [Punica granatum]
MKIFVLIVQVVPNCLDDVFSCPLCLRKGVPHRRTPPSSKYKERVRDKFLGKRELVHRSSLGQYAPVKDDKEDNALGDYTGEYVPGARLWECIKAKESLKKTAHVAPVFSWQRRRRTGGTHSLVRSATALMPTVVVNAGPEPDVVNAGFQNLEAVNAKPEPNAINAGPEPNVGLKPNAVNAGPKLDVGSEPDAVNAGSEPDAINVGPEPDTIDAGLKPDVGPEPNAVNAVSIGKCKKCKTKEKKTMKEYELFRILMQECRKANWPGRRRVACPRRLARLAGHAGWVAGMDDLWSQHVSRGEVKTAGDLLANQKARLKENYGPTQRLYFGSVDGMKAILVQHGGPWLCMEKICINLGKVQAVAWNSFRPHVLLSGSFDHTIVMASLEDGMVRGFDIRVAVSNPSSETKPTFTLHGHDKAVCKVSYNPAAPNVKLWDLTNNQPSCVASRSPKLIWDTLLDAAVSQRFGKYRK